MAPSLILDPCALCPRQCGTRRLHGDLGYCQTDGGLQVAAVTLHRGEEPAISGTAGICNVFFSHCNLRCLYCQNAQISRNTSKAQDAAWTLDEVACKITVILAAGIDRLGFVSPSHLVPQMVQIIRAVHARGYKPVIVYNSNGYDRVATLRTLEEWVDVYLPDYKYSDALLAANYSGAPDYPQVALAALGEMYRQKGNVLHLDDNGLAERGLIVRHLVLPGAVANSLGVMKLLAEHLSPRITLSLMAQYQPTPAVTGLPPLNRQLQPEEYQQVVAAMEQYGFAHGWVQELASADCYNPDFSKELPFEQ